MTTSTPPSSDPAHIALEHVCALAQQQLGAERVVAWRYSAWSRLVSPIAGIRREEDGPIVPTWWARSSIEDVEPYETCLQERRMVTASRARLRECAPELAEDLLGDSMVCVPLLVMEQSLGMLTAELAAPPRDDSVLTQLSACAAPLLAWGTAERGRAQAELLLKVIEAASAHEGSVAELLETVCPPLTQELGADRVSFFLRVGDRLVPGVAAFADGTRDATLWRRFRDAPDVPPMVEAAFVSGRPVRASHRHDPKLGWWGEAFGVESALAVALGTAPAVGVLMLDAAVARPYRADEIRILTAFASLLGEIVRRMQQAAARDARLAAGEAVRDLLKDGLASPDLRRSAEGLAGIVQRTLGAAAASVCLPVEGGTLREAARAVKLAVASDPSASVSLPALAPETILPASVDDAQDGGGAARLLRSLGLASGVVVPLIGYDGGGGVVVCGSTTPGPWSDRRLELASQLGLEGGLVLEAARLRELDAERRVELQHRASHDPLTGLGNRTLFYERAAAVLATAGREDREVALLLVDLDGFKDVNDGLGHDHGDRLLAQVAARLQASVRAGDIVARLGGDEFAVALTGGVTRESAITTARRIGAHIAEPVTLGEIEVNVGASIGVAIFPDHGSSTEPLLRRADAAMYEAKREHSGVEVYERQSGGRETPALLVQRLRRAIAGRQLVLHYQPKVDLRSGRVTGAEALVRWALPEGGFMPPAQFIPLAEATGLIREITPLVLEDALGECRRWQDESLDLSVAVNVSTPDLSSPGFAQIVEMALARTGVPADKLTIEITETSLIRSQTPVTELLAHLRHLGVSVSLDDFGTGYSSLGVLDQLPVSELKIDRSFLGNLDRPATAAIIRSVVSLGQALGLQVVAEGVETLASVRSVAQLGCDTAQGFYYARPLPAEEFRAWVTSTAQARVA